MEVIHKSNGVVARVLIESYNLITDQSIVADEIRLVSLSGGAGFIIFYRGDEPITFSPRGPCKQMLDLIEHVRRQCKE